jgi:hypothetical protein
MVIRKRPRFDRLFTGFLIGAIVPLIVLLITYQVKFSAMPFAEWISNLWEMKILLKLMSLCVFPNLGFFMIFYRKKYDMAARGVIMATFLYAFAVLIAKVI